MRIAYNNIIAYVWCKTIDIRALKLLGLLNAMAFNAMAFKSNKLGFSFDNINILVYNYINIYQSDLFSGTVTGDHAYILKHRR